MRARPKAAQYMERRRRPLHRPKLSGARDIWATVRLETVRLETVRLETVRLETVRSVGSTRYMVESFEAHHGNDESSEARHRTVESCLKTQYMVASSEVRHRTVESFGSRFSVGEVDARTRRLEDERRRTMVVQRSSTDARIHVWGFKPFPQDV